MWTVFVFLALLPFACLGIGIVLWALGHVLVGLLLLGEWWDKHVVPTMKEPPNKYPL
jgi:hypothetical protein